MKKVLITGVTSFVGNHLSAYLLKKGYAVTGTYRSESSLATLADHKDAIDLKQVNLMDTAIVNDFLVTLKPDYIYHLAAHNLPAESFTSPGEAIISNINLELPMLESLRKNASTQTKVVIVSSAQVYGSVTKADLPIDEETPLRPNNPYAVSKIAQDFLALQYSLSYDLPIIRVRPFNHIGPGQRDAFALPSFAKQIAQIEKGMAEPIITVGNLAAKRDFTDVRDIVRVYDLLADQGKPGDVYNIGSGVSHKMEALLAIMLSFSKKKITVVSDPTKFRPADIDDFYCDTTKVYELTGWKPEMPIERTLQDILDYWRNIV